MSKRKVYGVGVNNLTATINGKAMPWYRAWHNMLERCYCEKLHVKQPSYIGCSVCDEWLDSAFFKAWYESNYIDGYALDKDIIKRGNKVYCPEYCSYVPRDINNLITFNQNTQTKTKTGVVRCNDSFIARMKVSGKNKHIGSYSTEGEAYRAYVNAKAKHIRDVTQDSFDNGKITEDVALGLIRIAQDLRECRC